MAKSYALAMPMRQDVSGVPEKAPTDKALMKDHAKRSMRRATEDWVDGRMTTQEHNAVHARGKHILAGKRPEQFKGKSGERKSKYL